MRCLVKLSVTFVGLSLLFLILAFTAKAEAAVTLDPGPCQSVITCDNIPNSAGIRIDIVTQDGTANCLVSILWINDNFQAEVPAPCEVEGGFNELKLYDSTGLNWLVATVAFQIHGTGKSITKNLTYGVIQRYTSK